MLVARPPTSTDTPSSTRRVGRLRHNVVFVVGNPPGQSAKRPPNRPPAGSRERTGVVLTLDHPTRCQAPPPLKTSDKDSNTARPRLGGLGEEFGGFECARRQRVVAVARKGRLTSRATDGVHRVRMPRSRAALPVRRGGWKKGTGTSGEAVLQPWSGGGLGACPLVQRAAIHRARQNDRQATVGRGP